MAAIIGTGCTITFQSGLFAEILSATWSGITRESIDTTHHGTTGARTAMPASLYDPGELNVELILDNPDGGWITMIGAAAETVTLTFSNSNTWAASGFASEFEFSVPLEDRMTATAKLKIADDISLAAS